MSRFSSYGQRMNEIAAAAFAEYQKAAAAYKAAEERARECKANGARDAEHAARNARANAELLEAQENLRKAKDGIESGKTKVAALRKELEAAVNDYYKADPAALDSNTIELLKSGVLKSDEYAALLDKAQQEGNHTMARMVAKYAGERAESLPQHDEQARKLRIVSHVGNSNYGGRTLAAFDVMADVYSRAAKNPHMIEFWEQLTQGAAADL